LRSFGVLHKLGGYGFDFGHGWPGRVDFKNGLPLGGSFGEHDTLRDGGIEDMDGIRGQGFAHVAAYRRVCNFTII
jgi:hypothetical protein